MPDKILQDGRVVQVNDQPEQLARLSGLGLPPDLDAAERSAWRRFLPGGRLPWRELAGFEEEVNRLEQRRSEIEQKRVTVGEQLRVAPERDTENLAAWERSGRRGPRPEPSRPALEAELARLGEEERALLHAVDAVTADRARFVEKNRDRLVREAGKAREAAHERAVRALEELKDARSELVEARKIEAWSQLYPAAEAGRSPNFAALGGGLRRVGEKIGLQAATAAELVIAALREDLNWVSTAVTREQAAKLTPKPVSPGEVDRERDRWVEGALSLHAQGRSDERAGELARMRAKL